MKQDQSGRSMLEVLAVLAIIVLISMGGFYFWNKTQLSSQTQTLAQRLISIKNSRILSMSAHSGEKMPRKEKGPYDTQISIENGIDENNKDLFWITVETINVSLCDSLAEYDIGAKSIENNCEENKITFNFLKLPENASESDDSGDNEPSDTNPENGNPTECEEGYYLKDGACAECGENVKTCNDNGEPTECEEGYYLNDGACVECPDNYETCGDDGFTCQTGYYKNGDECKSCGAGVDTCDNTGKPTKCEEGYYLKDGACVLCPEHYETCGDDDFTCQTGYYKDGDECIVNSCPENSSETVREGYQIGTTGCYCNAGYELNGDKNGCIKISPCKGDMCCQNLFDAGFEVDTTCSSSVFDCSTQKDNTFYMYKPSSGVRVPYPIYKGDMTVNKDLSAPTCGLLLKDGHFTANANIELKDLTSYGLTLAAGKTITAEDVNINDGEILIESGATLNSKLLASSSPEVTTTLINRGTIKDVYQFPRYVENYGEIYSDGGPIFGYNELINKGTLHAEELQFEKIENSGTIILSHADDYYEANSCPNKAGILNNSGTIETAGCIDTYQFQQTAGSVITTGLYIGSNSENKDNPLVMSGGKLVVDNLYIFGDKNGPRLSGNSELIINSDYKYNDSTGIDLYISDNAMMQISPSGSMLPLRKFKMTGGVLKVPLLGIRGDFQQTGGEIYVCQSQGSLESVLIGNDGELSISGGFIKASGPICDYPHGFCYSKSSNGNYYNPHLIPNTDIPWCAENNL